MDFRDYQDEEPTPAPPVEAPKPKPPKGSGKRYTARISLFEADGAPAPKLRHMGFWLLHNCIAHPLLGFFPNQKTVEVHELTSSWLNHEMHGFDKARRVLHAKVPTIPNQALWVLHNVVSHVAIGVAPSDFTFAMHDWTAELMQIPGWV